MDGAAKYPPITARDHVQAKLSAATLTHANPTTTTAEPTMAKLTSKLEQKAGWCLTMPRLLLMAAVSAAACQVALGIWRRKQR